MNQGFPAVKAGQPTIIPAVTHAKAEAVASRFIFTRQAVPRLLFTRGNGGEARR